jgi:hypothetical protein
LQDDALQMRDRHDERSVVGFATQLQISGNHIERRIG